VDVQPGKPPMLRLTHPTMRALGGRAPRRLALRVVEHGSLLVRGLGLRDVAGPKPSFGD